MPDKYTLLGAVGSSSASAVTAYGLSYCYQSWQRSTMDLCPKPKALLAAECLLVHGTSLLTPDN